jgi:hypothetical protein
MSSHTLTPSPKNAGSSSTSVNRGVLQRQCACGQHAAGGECGACSRKLQTAREHHSRDQAEPTTVPPIVYEVLSSPGHPLDETTRAFFEPRFGHDLSQVRVHTDERAAASARTVSALAYTVGRELVFGAGQYAPGTAAGQSLLAHELTHVLQQTKRNGTNNVRPTWLAPPNDTQEREARVNAVSIMQGHAPRVSDLGRSSTLTRVDIPLYDCPKRLAPIALRQAESSGLPGLHNGPADAYRHCSWSCEMVRQCSWLGAYAAGTGHELQEWTDKESQMDLNNNAVGRDCGGTSAGSCDACCRSKLAAGQLTVLDTHAQGTGYYGGGPRPYISDTAIPGSNRYRGTE